jgi:hypothetical protein
MEGVATAAVADVGNTRRSSRISAQPAKEYDDVEDDIEDFDDDKPQSKRSGLQRETKKRKTMDRDPESHEYDDFDDSENNDIGEEDGDIQDNLEVDDADMDQTDSDLSGPDPLGTNFLAMGLAVCCSPQIRINSCSLGALTSKSLLLEINLELVDSAKFAEENGVGLMLVCISPPQLPKTFLVRGREP